MTGTGGNGTIPFIGYDSSPLPISPLSPPSPPPTTNEAQTSIQEQSFTILGDEITWTDAQTVLRDDNGHAYTGPQWNDLNGAANPTNPDQYDLTEGAPVSIVSSGYTGTASHPTNLKVDVEFNTGAALPAGGTYWIYGLSENLDLTFSGQAVPDGSTLRASLTSTQPVPSTILSTPLFIYWSVTRTFSGKGETEDAPMSFNHLYMESWQR